MNDSDQLELLLQLKQLWGFYPNKSFGELLTTIITEPQGGVSRHDAMASWFQKLQTISDQDLKKLIEKAIQNVIQSDYIHS